jgi:hypothetical protein
MLQKFRLCRSVIYDYENEVSVRLSQDALYSLPEVVRTLVKNWHDNCNLGSSLLNMLSDKITDMNSRELTSSVIVQVDFGSQINVLIKSIQILFTVVHRCVVHSLYLVDRNHSH